MWFTCHWVVFTHYGGTARECGLYVVRRPKGDGYVIMIELPGPTQMMRIVYTRPKRKESRQTLRRYRSERLTCSSGTRFHAGSSAAYDDSWALYDELGPFKQAVDDS